jgi:hypothetical protein
MRLLLAAAVLSALSCAYLVPTPAPAPAPAASLCVAIVAGQANVQNMTGDGGPGRAAGLTDPANVAVDQYGDVYWAVRSAPALAASLCPSFLLPRATSFFLLRLRRRPRPGPGRRFTWRLMTVDAHGEGSCNLILSRKGEVRSALWRQCASAHPRVARLALPDALAFLTHPPPPRWPGALLCLRPQMTPKALFCDVGTQVQRWCRAWRETASFRQMAKTRACRLGSACPPTLRLAPQPAWVAGRRVRRLRRLWQAVPLARVWPLFSSSTKSRLPCIGRPPTARRWR